MPDHWIPILRQKADGPVSILVRLDLRDNKQVPDPSRPSATCIRVAFSDPDEHGMGTVEDAQSIDEVMDKLGPRLASEASAEFVGRIRGGGLLRLFVYSDPAARKKVEHMVLKAYAGRSVEIEHRNDPTWQMYLNMLPTPREERFVLDLQVVQALQERGDPLVPKRDVRHFIYFFTQVAANQFVQRLAGQGFAVECREIESSQDGRGWSVVASRDDSVEHPQISDITGALAERAQELSGLYDGWEAMLIQPKKGLLGRLFKK